MSLPGTSIGFKASRIELLYSLLVRAKNLTFSRLLAPWGVHLLQCCLEQPSISSSSVLRRALPGSLQQLIQIWRLSRRAFDAALLPRPPELSCCGALMGKATVEKEATRSNFIRCYNAQADINYRTLGLTPPAAVPTTPSKASGSNQYLAWRPSEDPTGPVQRPRRRMSRRGRPEGSVVAVFQRIRSDRGATRTRSRGKKGLTALPVTTLCAALRKLGASYLG